MSEAGRARILGDVSPGDLIVSGPREVRGWSLMVVQGEIDLSTAPELREAIGKAIEQGADKLAIDLRDVSFMDSMGLGVLIGARRRLHESGRQFALICADGPCLRVIEISGVANLLGVVRGDDELPG